MRILMVIRTGYRKNPYVISLVDGLIKYGHQVTCGLDKFWDSFAEYDLLYFQWPEAIFDWGRGQIDLERLSRHFDSIKRAGVKTVITCHNLHSHMNDGRMKGLYDLVYSNMDAFHHLGRYSYDVMKEKYPDTIHFMAPHHIADCLWENPVDPFVAKRKLHIPKANVVVSSFGAFRNDEEIRLYVDMAKDITSFHMTFLAPRIPMGHFYHGRHVGKTIQYLFKAFLYKIIRIKHSGFLTEEELNDWLYASDIVMIQRKEILNSGNLPLAFSAGKVVVGPNLGNVGEILRETGNFVFDPNDRVSVKYSVLKAIEAVKKDNQLGLRNYQYAKENWSVSKVCGLIDKELTIMFKTLECGRFRLVQGDASAECEEYR